MPPEEIRWFHSIDLGDGVLTPGLDVTADRLDILKLPADLTGKSVLDVGAWDGFFSFECERRGAARVVAADSFAWQDGRAGFDHAHAALGSRVEPVEIEVLDLAPERLGGTFDVVLFLGVLYHMRHPLLALERAASVTAGQLVVETHVDLSFLRRPAMAFYPSHELHLDQTNWCGPNAACVVGMLRACGFPRVEVVTPDSTLYRAGRMARRLPRTVRHLAAHRALPPERISQGRVVVHAFRE